MKNRNKKGFTIMELVIVIAIVAVLAAVLIPTFAGLIKKANNSAYEQERTNQLINDAVEKIENTNWLSFEDFEKALAEGLAKAGSDQTNVEKAVKAALEEYTAKNIGSNSGLTESQIRTIIERSLSGQLTKTQVESIIRSALNNLESGITQEQIKKIVDDAVKDLGNTSISLEDVQAAITAAIDASGSENAQALKDAVTAALAGFTPINEDALKTLIDTAIDSVESDKIVVSGDDIASETYTVAADDANKTIYIVTDIYKAKLDVNGSTAATKIIIDAPNINELTVNGPAQVMRIFRTAGSSTHVKGDVGILNINSGRVVIEGTATVGQLTAAPAMRAVVTVDITENATVTDLYAEYQYYEGTNDYIVINNEGTVTNAYMTASPAVSSESTTNVVVNNSGSAQGTAAEALTVSYKGSNLSTNLVVDGTTYTTNGDQLGLFAGGSGTAEDPYLIVDYVTFQNVSKFYSDDEFHYWKCKDNLVINATDWTPVKLYGSIEGNGVVLNNLDNTLFAYAWNDRDNDGKAINVVKISNMTLNCNIFDTGSTAALISTAADDLYVDNVDVHGQIVGYSVGGYVDYGSGNFGNADTRNWQVTFKNCDNDAHLVSFGEGVGGFVQHPYSDVSNGSYAGKSLMTIIDSAFTGKMTSVSNMDYFAYQGNHVHVKTSYSSDFTTNLGYNPEGILYKSMNKNEDGMFDAGNYSGDKVPSGIGYPSNGNEAGKYRPNDSTNSTYKLKITSTGSNPANYGDAYTFTKVNGATTAKIAFMISPNSQATESGSYTGTYVDETVDISALSNGDTFTTDVIKYWTIAINPDGVSETGLTGTQYNVVNSFYGKTHNGSNIYAVQYASNGEVVGITSVNVCPSNGVAVMYNGAMIKSAAVGNDYEYDTNLDLSNYDVKVVFVDRDASWYYNFNYYAEFNGTNVADSKIPESNYKTSSTFEVVGSKVIIHNIERKADRYNYGSLRYGIIVTEKSN